MLICRVDGMVVSTAKDERLRSSKLLMVRRALPDGTSQGGPFVAVDTVGAGEDELVVVAVGSAARETPTTRGAPVDAAIVGIVDSLARRGATVFRKGANGHGPRS